MTAESPRTDEDLLRSYDRHGDRPAMAELVTRYQQPLYTLALRILGDSAAAEDVIQQVFLALLRRRTWQPGRPVRPWLFKAAIYTAMNRRRRERRETEMRMEAARETHAPAAPAPAETLAALRRAVCDLPDDMKLPVMLHYFHGESYANVAEILELPRSTIQSRIEAALAQLRRRAAELGLAGVVPVMTDALTRVPAETPPASMDATLRALLLATPWAPPAAGWLGLAGKAWLMKKSLAVILALLLLSLFGWWHFGAWQSTSIKEPSSRPETSTPRMTAEPANASTPEPTTETRAVPTPDLTTPLAAMKPATSVAPALDTGYRIAGIIYDPDGKPWRDSHFLMEIHPRHDSPDTACIHRQYCSSDAEGWYELGWNDIPGEDPRHGSYGYTVKVNRMSSRNSSLEDNGFEAIPDDWPRHTWEYVTPAIDSIVRHDIRFTRMAIISGRVYDSSGAPFAVPDYIIGLASFNRQHNPAWHRYASDPEASPAALNAILTTQEERSEEYRFENGSINEYRIEIPVSEPAESWVYRLLVDQGYLIDFPRQSDFISPPIYLRPGMHLTFDIHLPKNDRIAHGRIEFPEGFECTDATSVACMATLPDDLELLAAGPPLSPPLPSRGGYSLVNTLIWSEEQILVLEDGLAGIPHLLADGSFRIPGILPGEYTLRVTHPGCEPASLRFIVRDQDDSELPLRVRLTARSGWMSGHVLDERRLPLAGACVWCDGISAETDALGRFELKGLSETPSIVTLYKVSYGTPIPVVDGQPMHPQSRPGSRTVEYIMHRHRPLTLRWFDTATNRAFDPPLAPGLQGWCIHLQLSNPDRSYELGCWPTKREASNNAVFRQEDIWISNICPDLMTLIGDDNPDSPTEIRIQVRWVEILEDGQTRPLIEFEPVTISRELIQREEISLTLPLRRLTRE